MNAAEVLLMITSATLVVFLIVGIILGILLIRVTIQIKHVTQKAERSAEAVASFSEAVSSAGVKMLTGTLITKFFQSVMATGKSKSRKKKEE